MLFKRKVVNHVVKKYLPKNETLVLTVDRRSMEDGSTKPVAKIEVNMENAQDLITWIADSICTYEKKEP